MTTWIATFIVALAITLPVFAATAFYASHKVPRDQRSTRSRHFAELVVLPVFLSVVLASAAIATLRTTSVELRLSIPTIMVLVAATAWGVWLSAQFRVTA